MNNTSSARLVFFCGYYLRKIFSLNKEEDLFRKRFYRVTKNTALSIPDENERELTVKLTGGDPINTDLEDYVTKKAISGLFVLIADEELKIRKDPLARVTDILKSVFSTLDK